MLIVLSSGARATAAELHGRVEAGPALPVGAPQSDRFGAGGGGQVQAGLSVLPALDVQVFGLAYGAGAKGTGDTGAVAGGGIGARVLLPREAESTLAPWADAGVGVGATGSFVRGAVTLGAGLGFRVGSDMRLGPFVRLFQIIGTDGVDIDGTDARLLTGGLALEFGLVREGREASRPRLPSAVLDSDGDGVPDKEDRCPSVAGAPANQGCPIVDADGDGVSDEVDLCPKTPGPPASRGCPDSDGDGVSDEADLCPTVRGEPDNRGCPRYKQVVARYDDRLELSQKIFFAFDQATILSKSFSLLDEVARVLSDAPSLRVRIEGHTDTTGTEEHNRELSEARALSVRDYLIGKGIDPRRLDAKGAGSSEPLASNTTPDGRERNRRVEFVILEANKGSKAP